MEVKDIAEALRVGHLDLAYDMLAQYALQELAKERLVSVNPEIDLPWATDIVKTMVTIHEGKEPERMIERAIHSIKVMASARF